jgi:hypothetical protein
MQPQQSSQQINASGKHRNAGPIAGQQMHHTRRREIILHIMQAARPSPEHEGLEQRPVHGFARGESRSQQPFGSVTQRRQYRCASLAEHLHRRRVPNLQLRENALLAQFLSLVELPRVHRPRRPPEHSDGEHGLSRREVSRRLHQRHLDRSRCRPPPIVR